MTFSIDEWRMAHLQDLVARTEKRWEEQLTDFMPRSDAVTLTDMLSLGPVHCFLEGGYADAERVRICFSMFEDAPDLSQFDLKVLVYRGQLQFSAVTHRDFLGALMSLGIEREKFGDVLVRENGFDVVIQSTLEDYLLHTPLRVKRVPMTCRAVSLAHWTPPRREFEVRQIQVASMRLDAVIARAFHLSRTQAAALITAGQVQVNHRSVKAIDFICSETQVISATGKGKFCIQPGQSKSKKGKLNVSIALYR